MACKSWNSFQDLVRRYLLCHFEINILKMARISDIGLWRSRLLATSSSAGYGGISLGFWRGYWGKSVFQNLKFGGINTIQYYNLPLTVLCALFSLFNLFTALALLLVRKCAVSRLFSHQGEVSPERKSNLDLRLYTAGKYQAMELNVTLMQYYSPLKLKVCLCRHRTLAFCRYNMIPTSLSYCRSVLYKSTFASTVLQSLWANTHRYRSEMLVICQDAKGCMVLARWTLNASTRLLGYWQETGPQGHLSHLEQTRSEISEDTNTKQKLAAIFILPMQPSNERSKQFPLHFNSPKLTWHTIQSAVHKRQRKPIAWTIKTSFLPQPTRLPLHAMAKAAHSILGGA